MPECGKDERRLILNCARLHIDETLQNEIGTLTQKNLSWDSILAAAELHGVASLLHDHLNRTGALANAPADARRRLLQLSHRAAYQNQQFSSALHDGLLAFADAGLPVMVLKGPSLIELIYKRSSLRPLIDLNLLIHAEQWPAARAILSRLGYRSVIGAASEGFYRWRHSQLLLLRPKEFAVHLLLQWDFANWPSLHAIDYGRVWQEAQRVRLCGTDALIPSPADLVLYLCLQQHRHVFLNSAAIRAMDPVEFMFAEWTNNRLIWCTDIAEAIRHFGGAVDWKALVERAGTTGIAEPVHAALRWTVGLFRPPVEPWVLDALHPPSPRRSRMWLFAALASDSRSSAPGIFDRARFKAWWQGKPKATQLRLIRLLDLLEFIFPRPEELRLRYRLRSQTATAGMYIVHAGTSLVRGALGALPILYGMLTPRLSSIMRLRGVLFVRRARGKDLAPHLEKARASGGPRGGLAR